jgi:hypothetical protein
MRKIEQGMRMTEYRMVAEHGKIHEAIYMLEFY